MEYRLDENQLPKNFDQSVEENNTPIAMDSSNNNPSDQVNHVPVIQNIVCAVNLDCKLNLSTIARRAKNAQYDPKRLDAVLMRIKNPKTTAMIFASGKMLCTGAKSEQDSKTAARKYARIVQILGFPVKFLDFRIQNTVASCEVNFGVRLESLVVEHAKCSIYEPEIYPGLIYKIKSMNMAIMISPSGKIVIGGAKAKDDIFKAFEIISPVLQQYKKV